MTVTTLLVCGDASRGDDGAPIVAVGALHPRLAPGVRVSVVGQLEADELRDALAEGPCIVLDAVRGVAPGEIVDLPLANVPFAHHGWSSSHAVPLPATVALARALGADLSRGRVLGIGGQRFRLGEPLAAAVAAGIDRYREAIVRATAVRVSPSTGDKL